MIHGKTLGLAPAEVRAIERLSHRRMRPEDVVSVPLARAMAEVSAATRRRVGVLVDRRGKVTHVAVGDAGRIWLPDFGRVRAGTGRLRGLRWIVTHVSGEPLTRDDLIDVVRLRLDLVASLSAGEDGLPGLLHIAHLAPFDSGPMPHVVLEPTSVHALDLDFSFFIAELEAELQRAAPAARRVGSEEAPRAVLAHVDVQGGPDADVLMRELRELTRTAGIQVVAEEVQRRQAADSHYVFGSGRLQELFFRALQLDAEVVIFGTDLSPAQTRHISEATELKVVDRTQLILDIFAQHAKTEDGKLQVELAQLRYRLPRLHERHTALSRLTGGIGGRGPGETKLEIDRRRTKARISLLDRRISKLSKQRETRRRRRNRLGVPLVAIVGYTNAGKSTLLNALTGSDVPTENKLFATLDPTTRRLRFPEEREIVLVDTVGFIRDLPPDLVRAFRATVEEIVPASLLLHVLDLGDPDVEDQLESVSRTLSDLKLGAIPRLLVLNKVDLPHDDTLRRHLERRQGAVAVSALEPQSLRGLVGRLGRRLFEGDREDAEEGDDEMEWRATPLPSSS